MSLTATISGIIVPVLEDSLNIQDKIDERSIFSFVVIDSIGTIYRKGQPVTLVDSVLGTFTGYVNQTSAQNLTPNPHVRWTLFCVDQTYLLDKKASNKIYSNQYAGVIAVDQVQRYASSEGITCAAALRWDELLTDWQAGTLANTIATTNASDGNPGDGDLEIALAGTSQIISVSSASNFNAGTYSNTQLLGGVVQPVPVSALKLVANCTLNNAGNLYSYVKIWVGAQMLGTGYYFVYDVWLDPANPEAKVALDIVFSDGTTLRDSSVYNDYQSIPPHPQSDLSGLAVGQWYHRQFWLNNFNGKTVSYITAASEGDKVGVYIGWFKNIIVTDSGMNTILTVFGGTLNTSQQMQSYGYASSAISVVDTYPTSGVVWTSPAYSIDAVKILQSSYLSYNALVPVGLLLQIKYSLDYAAGNVAAFACTNNTPLPALPTGLSVVGRSLTLYAEFIPDPGVSTPTTSPEKYATLSSIQLALNPSYAMTKTDIQFACVQAGDWTQAGATLANTVVSGKKISLAGYVNNFDSNFGNTNLYGTATPGDTLSNRVLALASGTGTDARIKLNDPGQFQNFTAECDVLVSANYTSGFVYRCTNWGNSNDSYAYSVTVSTTSILLAHGNNSIGVGSFISISSASITLTSGAWHHLKIVVNGSTHQIYLDDILMINTTDSTYTAAGYIGLRIYNSSGSTQTAQFNNFGLMAALSGTWLSPSISLAGATTYGTSLISWRDDSQDTTNCTMKVEATINGGTTWVPCTNGASLPTLTAGQTLAGVLLQLRVTLTTTTASSMPALDNLIVRVLQQYSASGTRISPALSLANVGRAGTALLNWHANLPAGTSLSVQTSINGGATWQAIATPGAAITGIATQPNPIVDTFVNNTNANYTQGNFGGATGSFTWDTTNSRLVASGGNNGVLAYTFMLSSADNQITGDFDQADGSGLLCNYTATSSGYFIQIWDASAGGIQNKVKLFKRSVSANTQIGSTATINFIRSTYHRFVIDVQAGVIIVSMDGTQIITYTDGSPLGAGQSGFLSNNLARAYSLLIQQYGQNVSALSLLTKLTLTSTDPTVTPQILDMQAFVSSSSIGPGTLIPSASYLYTFLSNNIKDLSIQSNYWWNVFSDKSIVFRPQNAVPAPWIVQSGQASNLQVQNLLLQNSGDLYRNRQIMRNAMVASTFIEIKIGDGSRRSWNVAHPIIGAPIITMNSQTASVGVKNLDSGKQFYYQIGSTAIDQDGSIQILGSNDSYTISYIGSSTQNVIIDNVSLPNTVTQAQMAGIDGSSGVVESVYDASSLTVAASTTLANQLLQRYGNIGRTLSFLTLISGLAPGQQITCFVPELGFIDVQMLITNVSRSTKTLSGGGIQYWYSITAEEGPNLGSWVRLFASVFA